MPITHDTILEANLKMLGRTNRAILFASVNIDASIEVDTPAGEGVRSRPTPSLAEMLARINEVAEEEFLKQVREQLVVRSFSEFLDRFQPGFYYRVVPASPATSLPGSEDPVGAGLVPAREGAPPRLQGDDVGAPLGERASPPRSFWERASPPRSFAAPSAAAPARLEFALEGGEGWRKVRITADHPYLQCLCGLVKKRVRQDVSRFRVDTDASLFPFKPAHGLLFVPSPEGAGGGTSGAVALAPMAGPDGAAGSPRGTDDGVRILPAETLDAMVRALPVIVYGLEQSSPGSGAQPPTGIDSLDSALTRLRERLGIAGAGSPQECAFPMAADAFLTDRLAASQIQPLIGNLVAATLQGPSEAPVPDHEPESAESYQDLFLGLFSNALDDFLRTVTPLFETILGVYLLFNEFPTDVRVPDTMMPELIVANADLPDLFVTRPNELKRFFDISCAQATNQFRDAVSFVIVPNVAAFKKKRPQARSSPAFRAADLSNPGRLAVRWRQVQDPVSEYLCDRLSLDARQVLQGYAPSSPPSDRLLRMLVEGLNQVLYDRDFWDERRFASVALSERTRRLLELHPHGKALARLNRLLIEDAYPNDVARRQDPIMLADPLLEQIQAAQEAIVDEEGGYGRVTFVDEMLDLLDWGYQYGFQVLFSPEEAVRAGQVEADFFQDLRDNYAVDLVVQTEAGDCAVLCVPDFLLLPRDGRLITGRMVERDVMVGVDLPGLLVRACYVACGRLMANDVPAYLQRRLQQAHMDTNRMRTDLPGVGIDLALHPFLGETDVPADPLLNDGVIDRLRGPDMPFLVFTGESSRSPSLTVARSMRMLHQADGAQFYRPLHLFRQEVYLNRVLRAAQELGFGGAWPSGSAQAEAMLGEFLQFMLKWTKWYGPDRLVNSFPSKLQDGAEFTVRREGGNTFRIALGFVEGQPTEFRLTL